jgi:hypothetical protein
VGFYLGYRREGVERNRGGLLRSPKGCVLMENENTRMVAALLLLLAPLAPRLARSYGWAISPRGSHGCVQQGGNADPSKMAKTATAMAQDLKRRMS